MRQITCKKLGSVSSITVGRVYEIVNETDSRYTLVNDRGIQAMYGKNLFHDPIEVARLGDVDAIPAPVEARRRGRPSRAEQLARHQGLAEAIAAVPQAPPIRIVDRLEVNTDATNDDGSVSFSVVFDFGNNETFNYNTGFIIESANVSASCGIQSLNGLDGLRGHFETLRTRFDAFLAANANRLRLADDINVEEVFSSIASAWLQDLTATYQGEDVDVAAGILLLSTTEQSIARTPMLREALDNISVSTVEVRNPNSGNDIVMWSVAVEAE